MSSLWLIMRPPLDGKYISGSISIEPALSRYLRYADPMEITNESKISLNLWPKTKKIGIDFFSPGQGLICSTRLAKAIKCLADGVFIHGVNIYKNNGELINENYFLLNIFNRVNCVDIDKSVFKSFENGGLRSVKKLVFLPEKIPSNFNIFFAEDVDFDWPIISEELFLKLRALNFKNIEYIPIENYRSI